MGHALPPFAQPWGSHVLCCFIFDGAFIPGYCPALLSFFDAGNGTARKAPAHTPGRSDCRPRVSHFGWTLLCWDLRSLGFILRGPIVCRPQRNTCSQERHPQRKRGRVTAGSLPGPGPFLGRFPRRRKRPGKPSERKRERGRNQRQKTDSPGPFLGGLSALPRIPHIGTGKPYESPRAGLSGPGIKSQHLPKQSKRGIGSSSVFGGSVIPSARMPGLPWRPVRLTRCGSWPLRQ